MDYLNDGTSGDLMAVEIGTTSDEEHRVLFFERWASCPTYVGTPLPEIFRPLLSIPAHVAELKCVWSAMGLENNKSISRLDMMRLTRMTRVCVKTREEAAATLENAKTYTPGCLYSLSTSSGADTLDEEDVDDPSSIFGALSVYQELVLRGDTAAVDATPGGRNAEDQTMAEHLTEVEQSTVVGPPMRPRMRSKTGCTVPPVARSCLPALRTVRRDPDLWLLAPQPIVKVPMVLLGGATGTNTWTDLPSCGICSTCPGSGKMPATSIHSISVGWFSVD